MNGKPQKLMEFGLIVVVLVLLNVASQRVFYRCDLTEDERFTLASASVQALSHLDETLTIKAFFSGNIPPAHQTLLVGVRDVLAEFKAHGGARVQIEFIDPYDDPETMQEMRLLGIPELTMTVVGRDELEQRKIYMGLGIFYEDRKEVIQAVSQLNDFEYNLTSAILKISEVEPKQIGIWLGNPDPGGNEFWEDYQRYHLTEEMDPLYRSLRQQYGVSEVTFDSGRPVPQGTNTLLVVGPKRVSERDLYEIDQFLMRGGKIVFLVDVAEQDERMQAQPVPSGIEPLLEHYGVRVEQAMVADRRCERAPFRTRFIQSIAPYPFWPKVMDEGVDRGHPALATLQAVVFPWTSNLSVVPGQIGGRTFTPLLRSSPFVTAHPLPAQLFGEQPGLLPASEQEPLSLAGLLEGPFESYFQGKAAPDPSPVPGRPLPPLPPELELPGFIGHTDAGRIIVVGSSLFTTAKPLGLFQQLRSGAQNLFFLQNLVDWLTLGEGLIGMRARVAPSHPLRAVSEGARQGVKWLNLLVVPFLVIVFGVGRFLLRRRDQRAYEERHHFSQRRVGASAAKG